MIKSSVVMILNMKKTIFLHSWHRTNTLNGEAFPVNVCFGLRPQKDIREYDYLAFRSDIPFPKEWLDKIRNKPILIFGFGKSSRILSMGETDAFSLCDSYKQISFDYFNDPGATVKSSNNILKELYSEGYSCSFKTVPPDSEVVARDIGNNPLVWKMDNCVWFGLPVTINRLAFADTNVDERISHLLLLSRLAKEFFQSSDDAEPEWVNETYFAWEDETLKENSQLKVRILGNDRKLAQTLQIRSIYWKKGTPLELAIKAFLTDVGIQTSKKHGSDLVIQRAEKHILLEIKGMEKNMGRESRPEIEIQINNHIKEWKALENEEPKIVLIINQQHKTRPKERSPLDKKQIAILTEESKCCVISGIELLKIYELIKEKKITTEEFLDKIASYEGNLDHSAFS